jgi:hypothetical protein
MYFTFSVDIDQNNGTFEEEQNHLVQEGENVEDEHNTTQSILSKVKNEEFSI